MKFNRLLALCLSVICMSFLFISGYADESIPGADWVPTEDVTITMMTWGGNARHAQRQSWIDEFCRLYPNYTIEYVAETEKSLTEKIPIQAAAGEGPDIYHMSSYHLQDFYEKNLCEDLKPYIDAGLLSTNGYEQKLNVGQIDGKQIQWPTMSCTYSAIYYNKTQFDKLGVEEPKNGWTWDEYFDTMRKLQSKITDDKVWASEDEGGLYRSFELWLVQHGKSFCNNTGLNFDKDDLVAWLNIWDGLRKEGVVPPADIQSEYFTTNWESSMVTTGMVLMNTQSFTHLVGMNSDYPDDYGMVASPWLSDRKKEAPVISVGYCINPNSKHKAETVFFLNWLNQSEFVQRSCFGYYSACTNKSISDMIRKEINDKTMEASTGMLETIAIADYYNEYTVAYPPQPSGSTAAQDLLKAANEMVAFDIMSVDEAADDFFQQCEQLF